MAKWIFLSTPCLTCLIFLAAGALGRQLHHAPAAAPASFIAQSFTPDSTLRPGNANAPELLAQVMAKLRDVRWLKFTLWQRLHERRESFETETRLLLGPDHCARVESTIHVAGHTCRTLVVSDGRAIAEVTRYPGESDQVTSCLLPPESEAASRQEHLRKRGCVGPQTMLGELKARVTAWRVETGVWRQRPVLRLEGTLDPAKSRAAAQVDSTPRSCRLYLDAATLMPLRLEWFRGADPQPAACYAEIEYRDLELNRPLSPQECAQAFTYDQDGSQ